MKKFILFVWLFSFPILFAEDSAFRKIVNGTREITKTEFIEIDKVISAFYKDFISYDYEKIKKYFSNNIGHEILILRQGYWIVNKNDFNEVYNDKPHDFSKRWSYLYKYKKFHRHFVGDENMPGNAYDINLEFRSETEPNQSWFNTVILVKNEGVFKLYWLIDD